MRQRLSYSNAVYTLTIEQLLKLCNDHAVRGYFAALIDQNTEGDENDTYPFYKNKGTPEQERTAGTHFLEGAKALHRKFRRYASEKPD